MPTVDFSRPEITGMLHADLLALCQQAGVKAVHTDPLRAYVFHRTGCDFTHKKTQSKD